jgi:hypothetical protein
VTTQDCSLGHENLGESVENLDPYFVASEIMLKKT